MKGIILAGGKGTRLYPTTRGICKQLIPIYDKPMVYYALSVLMLAGIKDILIITTQNALINFQDLFGKGEELGVNISYAAQDQPRGIAESFLIGKGFIGKDKVCLILGDNIFFGHGLPDLLQDAVNQEEGATIFGYYVRDPRRYAIIEFDEKENVTALQEKPAHPRSNWAVTGLYFYDNEVIKIAETLVPSARGELEITDVNNAYLARGKLQLTRLGRGYAWLDTGTCDSLIDASMFIKTIEDRQGLKIGCIEEIAYRMGYLTRDALEKIARQIHTSYGEYLLRIVEEERSS
ncbi:MAG: glucose-1-phosphate thymidylyltransferase RfbA [Candidatus Omnitrophica bacterium]|nr:glucose-1-phosphate thymidylyltransferase RfbA [Candidatus Omnitrophota bacterium]